MVVMLRTLGIPSRLAAGFTLQADPQSDTYRVHAANAFAWPEVYFPGLGWIEFSPAPVQPLVARTGEELAVFPSEQPLLEGLLGQEYLDPQQGEEPTAPVATPVGVEAENNTAIWVLVGVMTGVMIVIGGSAVGAVYAWNRSLTGLSYPERVWEKTLRLASWTGLRPQATQTPREYVRDLQEGLPEVRDLPLLLRSYESARFGRRQVGEEEKARLEVLWRELRSRLLRRILRKG
jgi:transglutaminase-like putative cysteine protease